MFHDYKVAFRREETLANLALSCRQFAGSENAASFNVVKFIERDLPRILTRMKKGPLQIKFFDMQEGEKPAFVTYNPLALHVDREIWELADIGDPTARLILAHEIGHILLHDHHAQGFSDDPTRQVKFAQKEERAEWQANTFASYFLVTRAVLGSYSSPLEIANCCNVPLSLAEDRVTSATEEREREERCARSKGNTGRFCGNCWNSTLVIRGTTAECQSCGFRKAI